MDKMIGPIDIRYMEGSNTGIAFNNMSGAGKRDQRRRRGRSYHPRTVVVPADGANGDTALDEEEEDENTMGEDGRAQGASESVSRGGEGARPFTQEYSYYF